MKLKRLVSLLLILILAQCPIAFAKEDITVIVSGEKVKFDVEPEITDGRTMVPVRAIFEAMGATVSWDPDSAAVTAEKLGRTVEFVIGEKEADYSGKKVKMDVPAVIKEGRTLVPARFSAEGLGYVVSWDSKSKTVTIDHDTSKLYYYSDGVTPDYGALYDLECVEAENGVFIYDIKDIASSDPEISSIKDYMDILYEIGFSFMGDEKVKEDEIEGTVYTFLKGSRGVSIGLLKAFGDDGLYISLFNKSELK